MTSVAPPPVLLPRLWPYGDGRPWTASTAVWTAVVTVGCALLGAVVGAMGLAVVDEDRTADLVLLVLAPAAVLALVGARLLARRRGRGVLIAGLAAIAAVLAVAGVLDSEMRTVGIGLATWLAVCLAPPFLSACFALAPSVGHWLARRRPPVAEPPAPRPDAATTAGVLGIITGIPLTLLGWVAAAEALREPAEDTGVWWVLPLGIALLVGARLLLSRRSLLPLAVAAAVALLWGTATVLPGPAGAADLVVGLVLVVPLPAATLVATLRRPVREWFAAR